VKITDISLPLSSELPVWPGDPQIKVERYRTIAEGNISNDSRLVCSVHSGTHVDAPVHFFEGASTVDKLPLDILIGETSVVEFARGNVITPDMLAALKLPEDTTRLLFKTSNSMLWADPHHRFNPNFVALSSDAAKWIIDRGVRLVGVDYLSVQKFDDSEPVTHRILLAAGVVIVEGLNLQNVQPGSYRLICLPLKLVGSDGAPARVVLIRE
jgi:arylformamidase